MVRFPIVLGHDDPSNRLRWHVERVQRQGAIFFPSLNAKLSLISADDAAMALAQLAEISVGGPLNVGAEQPLAITDLLNYLRIQVGEPHLTDDPGALAAHSPFAIEHDWNMSIARARELGLSFQAIDDWLPPLINHFRC